MKNFVLEGPGGIPGLQQTRQSGGSATTTSNWNFTGSVAFSGSVSGVTASSGGAPFVVTGANAGALVAGANGATNPQFNVDTSVSSVVTGLNIKGAAAAGGLAVTVLSSGTNESLTIDAKGTGSIGINNVSGSGTTTIGHSLIVGAQGSSLVRISGAGNQVLAAGPNGGTNPSFNVDASTASAVTGFNVKSAASGAGLALSLISSGTNESLTVAAKGTGTVTFNPAVVATAGGAANDGIQFGSLSVGLFTGTGAPTFSAMNGSLYTDSASTTISARLYINKSGAGTAGTTWTAVTTVA